MKRVVKKITNGNHIVPIHLEQDTENIGLYSPTDGNIGQIDVICNFVIKTQSGTKTITIKDGVDLNRYSFVKGLSYTIEWGDGTEDNYQINGDLQTHTYANNGEYVITMLINSPWGNHKNEKTINLPSVESTDITFDTTISTPELLGYDSQIVAYVNTSGVIICEGVQSRLTEFRSYGGGSYVATINDTEGMSGINGISQITGNVFTYYIDRIKYMDDNGNTTISLYPDLFTSGDVIDGIEYINEMLSVEDTAMVHQEVFHGITNDIEIQSNIFIERGKQAPFEFYYKLSEVSNMVELERNGNKFFKINNDDDFKL